MYDHTCGRLDCALAPLAGRGQLGARHMKDPVRGARREKNAPHPNPLPAPLRFAGRGSRPSARHKQTTSARGKTRGPVWNRELYFLTRAPSCFETHRRVLSQWTHPSRAAMLLSMRANIARASSRLKHARRRVTSFVFAVGLTAAVGMIAGARAEPTFPSKPIHISVPYGAGGVADLTMRLLAQKLTERTKQQVVIENRPGAGGLLSAKAVLEA